MWKQIWLHICTLTVFVTIMLIIFIIVYHGSFRRCLSYIFHDIVIIMLIMAVTITHNSVISSINVLGIVGTLTIICQYVIMWLIWITSMNIVIIYYFSFLLLLLPLPVSVLITHTMHWYLCNITWNWFSQSIMWLYRNRRTCVACVRCKF